MATEVKFDKVFQILYTCLKDVLFGGGWADLCHLFTHDEFASLSLSLKCFLVIFSDSRTEPL